MTYAFRRSRGGHSMLVELTARELAELAKHPDPNPGGVEYHEVTTPVAHKWVRDGGLHSTYLWVDRGKIRRA